VADPAIGLIISGATLQSSGNATDVGISEGVEVYYRITNGTGTVTPPATRAAAKLDILWSVATEDASWNNIPITLGAGVAGEGEKRIHFVAYDQLDHSTPHSRRFYVDVADPYIKTWGGDITTPSGVNLIGNTDFGFTFTASDTNALDSVTITRDGTSLSGISGSTTGGGSYTIAKTELDTYNNWRYVVSFTGQANGDYVYGIEIRDVAGKPNHASNDPMDTLAYKTFNVRIDTEGPDLAITYPINSPLVRSTKLIAYGTATDATMEGMKVWYKVDILDENAITAPSDPASAPGWAETEGTSSWGVEEDLTLQPEGYLWLHVIARDSLGNVGDMRTERFSVDYSPPKIESIPPDDFAFTGNPKTFADDPLVYAGPAYGFTFRASDSNALDSVVVTRNGVALANPEIILNPAHPFPSNTKTVDVTVSLTGQSDGNNNYVIEITDTAGQKNTENNNTDGDPADDHKTFTVRVDTTAPTLNVNVPSGDNAISDSTMLVSGTATDVTTSGLTVWYKVDISDTTVAPASTTAASGAGWEEAPGGVNWSENNVPLPGPGVHYPNGEGTYWVHFVAFDKLGNGSATPIHKRIYVDRYLPYMSDWDTTGITAVGDYYYAKEGPYGFSFKAKDSNALQSVAITRNNAPATASISPTLPGTGETSADVSLTHTVTSAMNGNYYSYVIDIMDVRNKHNNLENTSGDSAIDPTVEDSAFRQITVWADTEGPNLSVSAPSADNPPVLPTGPLPVRGMAIDSGAGGVRVYYAIDNNDDKPETLTPEDPGFASNGWTLVNLTAFSTGANLSFPAAEGVYYAHFIAYDLLGNQAEPVDRKFYVDYSAPQISAWSATPTLAPNANTNLTQDNYGIGFTAVDTNALQSLTIYRNGVALTKGSDYTVDDTTDPKSWPVTLNAAAQADGNYPFVIDIRDVANRQNANNNDTPANPGDDYRTFSIRIDTTGPVVSISQPTVDFPVNSNNLSISGTAVDALLPTTVEAYYLVDANDTVTTPPATVSAATGAGWTKAAGGSSWYHNADITGLSEGTNYVHVIAFDELGNASQQVADRSFVKDTGPPTIESWGITPLNVLVPSDAAYHYAENGTFTISFTAKDGNRLQSVEIKRNGALLSEGTHSDGPGSYTLTINKTDNKSWPVTLAFTGQGNDDYAFELIIKDAVNPPQENIAGGQKTFTVRVDTAPPALTVANPTGGNDIGADTMLVSGTATDATPDDLTVWYKVDSSGATGTPSSPPTPGTPPTLSGWTLAPGGASWNKSDVPLPVEGDYWVHFVAFDKLGNGSVTPIHKRIYVDYALPYMDNWAPTGITRIDDSYYAAAGTGSYNLSFTARDTNALKSIKITRNGAANDVTADATITPSSVVGEKSATVSLSQT
jgi:hypothetical protein